MGFKNSSYVENMRVENVKRFDDEMALREFRQRFKSQIEDGLTLEKARQKYQMTAADIVMFKKLLGEVTFEKEQGQAFLAGFMNKSNGLH